MYHASYSSIKLLSDGSMIVAGSYLGGGDQFKGTLVKYSSTGNELWRKTYEDISKDNQFLGLQIDDTGIYVTGSTATKYTGARYSTFMVGKSFITMTTSSDETAMIVKYDFNGNVISNNTIAGYKTAINIDLVKDGIVVNLKNGNDIPAVAKYSKTLTEVWKTEASTDFLVKDLDKIISSKKDYILVTGGTESDGAGDSNYLLFDATTGKELTGIIANSTDVKKSTDYDGVFITTSYISDSNIISWTYNNSINPIMKKVKITVEEIDDKTISWLKDEDMFINQIIEDKAGNIIAVGDTASGNDSMGRGTFNNLGFNYMPNSNSFDNDKAIIKKYDKEGKVLWSKESGADGTYSVFTGVALTEDGGYLAVLVDMNGLTKLIKYDKDGTKVSENALSGMYIGYDIIKLKDGNYAFTGLKMIDSGSSTGIVTVKVNEAGDIIWEKVLKSAADTSQLYQVTGIAELKDGTIIIVGSSTGGIDAIIKLKSDGTIISNSEDSTATFVTTGIVSTPDGGYATLSIDMNNLNSVLRKYKSDGTEEWNKIIQIADTVPALMTLSYSNNKYYLSGSNMSLSAYTMTGYTYILDKTGEILSTKVTPSSDSVQYGTIPTSDNGLVTITSALIPGAGSGQHLIGATRITRYAGTGTVVDEIIENVPNTGIKVISTILGLGVLTSGAYVLIKKQKQLKSNH